MLPVHVERVWIRVEPTKSKGWRKFAEKKKLSFVWFLLWGGKAGPKLVNLKSEK